MSLITFGGLASGIQSQELIAAISKATRRQRVEPNLQKISSLKETNAALSEFKGMLSKLQGISLGFATLSGGAISKLATSSNEQVMTATAGKNAQNGTYNFTVEELAKTGTMSFGSSSKTYSSGEAKINSSIAGTETIAVTVGGEQVLVNVNGDTSLNDFVSSFNAQSSKGIASLVNTGTGSSPDYKLVITSKETGVDKGSISVNMPEGLDAFDLVTESEAKNARFVLDGVGTIERATNTINDVISGLSLKLESTGNTTITIGNDTSLTKEKVQEFVDAYNSIVEFVRKNNTITRDDSGAETKINFGALSSTRIDSNALTALRSAISSSVFSEGSNVRIFADLGITTKRDGTLEFDESKFDQALTNDPDAVNEILKKFGDKVGTTNGVISQYIKFNSLIDLGIQGNERQISNLNDRVARAEQFISNQENILVQRFARLESLIGGLQGQREALTGAMASLGFYR